MGGWATESISEVLRGLVFFLTDHVCLSCNVSLESVEICVFVILFGRGCVYLVII